MGERLTRRFLISSMEGLNLSDPICYERYYIDQYIRIQKKGEIFEKEILKENLRIEQKEKISKEEFEVLKKKSSKSIVRDSYLWLEDTRVSIKQYYGKYKGLVRVEVNFTSKEEMKSYQKEKWMEKEITMSPLAFDSLLIVLTKEEFDEELKKQKNTYL